MKEAEPVEALTADDVELALRAHYVSPKYAFVTGVRSAAGWSTRTCDALALGTWGSTGHDLHGIEIKCSRGDWIREMQDPEKAETFVAYCDYWWIAAPPKLVKLEELPATWGLMEVVGKGVKVRRPASKRRAPKAIGRSFLAAIFRRVVEQSPAETLLATALEKARHQARDEERASIAERRSAAERQTAESGEVLEAFTKATGVYLGKWNVPEVAERFKRFVATERAEEAARNHLEYATKGLERVLGECRLELGKLDARADPPAP